MNKSDSIGALAKALSIVQSKLQPAVKDAANPFFKAKYADLNSVWQSCRALLSENGLAVAQVNQFSETGVVIETVLMHESGEWISGEMYLPLAKHDPQGVGSATTYGRRYGLAAIVGIVADEDDDGNAASNRQVQKQATKPIAPMQPSMQQRIGKAIDAIAALGIEPSKRSGNESDEDFLESLTAQYKRAKATAEAK